MMQMNRRQALLSAGAALGTAFSPAAFAAGKAVTRAYEIGTQKGYAASLSLVTRSRLKPGPGEVRVKVRASALNHRDLSIAAGGYGGVKPGTRIPLGDGAGEIVELGAGVSGFALGDRVTSVHFTPWIDGEYFAAAFARDLGNSADGWLADDIILPAPALIKLPDYLSYEEAAALPAAGVTAWSVIEAFAHVKAGDTVMALGTGGVSVMALQVAKMAGARMVITSSSDEKLARAKALGADITVNYKKTPDWDKAVMAATGGRGVDIVVETVGLSTLGQTLACCATNARVGLVGSLAPARTPPENLYGTMVSRNIIMKGITSGSRKMLENMLTAMTVQKVKPVIDKTFAFAAAKDAFAYLDSGEHFGKVVITHGA